MLQKTLHLFLIATILACPLFCRSGLCVCAEECCAVEASEHNECPFGDHCHDEPSHHEDSHDEHPDRIPCDHGPGDHGPCESCQCICGGAVVVENNDDLVTQDVEDTLHPIGTNHQSIADLPFRQHCRTKSPHDGSIAPSRSLCVLYESFLL